MQLQDSIRNPEFASKLALTYAEYYDGVSPVTQRASIRVSGDGSSAVLEVKNATTHAVETWKVSQMRQIADQARDDAFIFAPDDASPARIIVTEYEALRAIFTANPRLKPLTGPRGQWRRLAVMAAGAAASIAGILFLLVPFMADRGAAMIPPQTEAAMGQTAFQSIYPALGAYECSDPAGRAALQTMQARLTQGMDLPYPVVVRVVSDPTLNATALPGGHVTIHNGLIQAAESPEEVAAVFAHEIGHVAHRDGTRSMLRAMGSFGIIGLAYGDFLGGSVVAGVTQQLINSSYSREAETRADDFAHQAMLRAGLPPQALGDFFRRIEAQGPGIDLGVFQHISTHPEMRGRIEAAAAAGAASRADGPPALTADEWLALRNICSSTAAPNGAVVSPGGAGTKG